MVPSNGEIKLQLKLVLFYVLCDSKNKNAASKAEFFNFSLYHTIYNIDYCQLTRGVDNIY